MTNIIKTLISFEFTFFFSNYEKKEKKEEVLYFHAVFP